ncbi:mannosyltransferase [Brachybacterium ginsengisoli]|uniref:Mannosyltransferase n=1 Tax=Brachybacterium ginsengisoli TaxID=1331682 RepID=A0A291H0Q9_9MICO|nr:ABC transporter ATP-binding protein [Brachybacterium ginsengisoli]ATG56043.1 mannosyltransferase [Brachybacterium ginsengisoli]
MNTGASSSTVVAEDVSKVFFSGGDPVWALENFSLTLEPGSFTCIVGPSGCGKSTFLRILGGLEERTVGEVTITGAEHPVPAAFVFQEHGVFPWMTVLDNVAFGLRMAGVPTRERLTTARDWLARVRLTDFADSYPHQLSGGMRQRVAIARAFATGSPVLLMDEPLGALDAQTRMLMQEELIALWEQERKTVLMVTHDIDESIILSDRVIVMSGRPGTLREDITIPFERPRSFDIERSPEFGELRSRIWNLLRDDVRTAEETA